MYIRLTATVIRCWDYKLRKMLPVKIILTKTYKYIIYFLVKYKIRYIGTACDM